jgi:hypothetical protein
MTIQSDERVYERTMSRAARLTLVLGGIGVLSALVWRGWPSAAGFALGSAASWLNLRWLKRTADALGGTRTPRRLVAFAAFRYVLLAAGAYVILRYSPVSLPAALAGLFVAVAAVLVGAVFELAYARN